MRVLDGRDARARRATPGGSGRRVDRLRDVRRRRARRRRDHVRRAALLGAARSAPAAPAVAAAGRARRGGRARRAARGSCRRSAARCRSRGGACCRCRSPPASTACCSGSASRPSSSRFAVWALAGISVALGDPQLGAGDRARVRRRAGAAGDRARAVAAAARSHAAMAERPRILRALRAADALALAACAVALFAAPGAGRRRASSPTALADPSVDGADARAPPPRRRRASCDARRRSRPLPGSHPAVGGGRVAWIGPATVVVVAASAPIPAPGADAVAVAARWVAWRASGSAVRRAVARPALGAAAASSTGDVGRPALGGNLAAVRPRRPRIDGDRPRHRRRARSLRRAGARPAARPVGRSAAELAYVLRDLPRQQVRIGPLRAAAPSHATRALYGTVPDRPPRRRRRARPRARRGPHSTQLWPRPPTGVAGHADDHGARRGRRLRHPPAPARRPGRRLARPLTRAIDAHLTRGRRPRQNARRCVTDATVAGAARGGGRWRSWRSRRASGGERSEKQPTAVGTGGAAASVDPLATDGGDRRAAKGGNAFDAAIAAASVLGVVEPYSCGIGGGGFMTIRDGETGKITTLDSRETAPATMKPDSFFINGARPDGRAVPDQPLQRPVASACPARRALWDVRPAPLRHLLARAGARLRRERRHATASPSTRRSSTRRRRTTPYFDDVPSTAAIYLDPDGTPRDVGTDDHATPTSPRPTSCSAAGRRARASTRGALGRRDRQGRADTPAARRRPPTTRGGPACSPTQRPRAATRSIPRDPVHLSYRGNDIYGMGPPSSGGTTDARGAEHHAARPPAGRARPRRCTRYLEASRLAYADRNAYLGDPAFVTNPIAGLLDPTYAAASAPR